MKVTFIKSACVIIEFNETKVLCDPWLTDGVYYGSWYHYPPLKYHPDDFKEIDYIYISHIHPDHMDKFTLEQFSKEIPVLIHDYQEKFLYNLLKVLGFKKIIEVSHKDPFTLADNFTIDILAADNCDPAVCGKFFGCPLPNLGNKSMQIDSLAIFKGGTHVVVNTNDCQYELAKDVCDYILASYKKIDLVLVGYGSATAYPQCFENLSIEEKIEERNRIRTLFLTKAALYLKHLSPSYFIPFAGQYVLGGKLHVLNKYRSPPFLEELPHLFGTILKEMKVDSKLILLNSGEFFDLTTKSASAPFVKDNAKERQTYIETVLALKKYSYEEEYKTPKDQQVDLLEPLKEAYEKMTFHQKRLGYHSNWKVYLDVGFDFFYEIPFNEREVTHVLPSSLEIPYVKISLDYSLLVMILNKTAHWNNAEIGSHLSFYRSPNDYEVGVFRFLSFLHL